MHYCLKRAEHRTGLLVTDQREGPMTEQVSWAARSSNSECRIKYMKRGIIARIFLTPMNRLPALVGGYLFAVMDLLKASNRNGLLFFLRADRLDQSFGPSHGGNAGDVELKSSFADGLF